MEGKKIAGVFTVFVVALAMVFSFGISNAMMGGHSGKGMMGSGGSGNQGMMGKSGGKMMGKSGKGHGGMMGGMKVFEREAFGMKLEGNIVDVRAQMKKLGRNAPSGITHHIMITPSRPFPKGTKATLIVKSPSGEKKEVGLMAMGNHMGADLYLPDPGKYVFDCQITSGGESTEFQFSYQVEK